MAQNIKCNPPQFLARREANSGYEIEICPRHQILEWCGVYAGAKPFMEWTPGLTAACQQNISHFRTGCRFAPLKRSTDGPLQEVRLDWPHRLRGQEEGQRHPVHEEDAAETMDEVGNKSQQTANLLERSKWNVLAVWSYPVFLLQENVSIFLGA